VGVLSTKTKAVIHLEFSSEKQITTLIEALMPEVQASLTHRSNVQLYRADYNLVLEADAEDTVALRATINSYLRWINSILNVMDALKKE